MGRKLSYTELGLWDSDRKSFFKSTLELSTTKHCGEQKGSETRGSCQRKTCVMIEKMHCIIYAEYNN